MIPKEIEKNGDFILDRIYEEIREDVQYLFMSSLSYGAEELEQPEIGQKVKKIAEKWKPWMDYWDIHGIPVSRLVQKRKIGRDTPESVPGVIIPESLHTRVFDGDGILQMFVFCRMPPKYLKWLLSAGFDPNRHDGRITAVGSAAYSGDLKALDIFWRFGADLELEAKSEHFPPSLAGSTLLLRVMSRVIHRDKKIPMVRYLAERAELPIKPTQIGRTIFDVEDPDALMAVLEVLARRESESISCSTAKVLASNRKQKRI